MLKHLLLPFWLAQLVTQEKSFERNALLGSRWLNESGLHTMRVRAAHALATSRRRRLARFVSDADRAQLDRDGFIVKHDFLPPELFRDLVAQVRRLRVAGREMIEGDTVTRRVALDPHVLAQVPAARRLLDLPDYRNLINYTGSSSAAPMVYLETILTQAVAGPQDPQTAVHADTFHPTVKAWLYLSDAVADAMPLLYVPGSHRLTPQRLEWERRMSLVARDSPDPENRQGSFRVAPHELAEMGLPPPQAVEGLPNTLIVADTFGFHARGRSPAAASRVEIWAFGRRNPFLPMVGCDPWSIEGLGLRKPVIYWRLLDVMERAGLARQRWKACGEVCPFDPPTASRPAKAA